MNTTDQARWPHKVNDATARPNKRQRRASSEELPDWSQWATPNKYVSPSHNAENGDLGNCSKDLGDIAEGMLTDFAEKLHFASWGPAEEESADPDPDEWHNRLYEMGTSRSGEYPLSNHARP